MGLEREELLKMKSTRGRYVWDSGCINEDELLVEKKSSAVHK
jgi:hypothetical protein